jgi:hypothetical protein
MNNSTSGIHRLPTSTPFKIVAQYGVSYYLCGATTLQVLLTSLQLPLNLAPLVNPSPIPTSTLLFTDGS